MKSDYFDITYVLTWTLLAHALLFIIKYHWNRRWLYYYASKMDGPFAWPIIGSAHHFLGGEEVFYKNIMKVFESQPSIFRFWLGKDLLVMTSRPEDVEFVLNNCLEKPEWYYKFGFQIFRNGLLIAPVNIWKDRRKIINPTFNQKNLNSFIGIFVKHGNKLVKVLDEYCGEEFDVYLKLFKCTLDIACETFADVDSTLIKDQDVFMQKVEKAEDVLTFRLLRPWLHPVFIWKYSSFSKEVDQASLKSWGFVKQILGLKKTNSTIENDFLSDHNSRKKKKIVNHLLNECKINSKIDYLAVEEETHTILGTGSETTAITIGMVLIVLGIYPEIQEKIVEELNLICNDGEDITLENINQMEYLERVIKETLRVLPSVPVIARLVEQNIKLEPYTIPAGSIMVIPIGHINKKPEFWEDPEKFDPDRFLPENSSNRHRCNFIPFSYGPRNCIGFNYGMMSMKVLLAAILRKFTIKASQYKSLEDVELIFGLLAKPKHGVKIKLEKRIVSK